MIPRDGYGQDGRLGRAARTGRRTALAARREPLAGCAARTGRRAALAGRALLTGLLFVFLACAAVPSTAWAQASGNKVVRVGWYESAFHRTDEYGRRSGYGYEYQQRIATYTGWTYEYVEGSWSELLEKLIAGDLDLLSDVSYTDERAQKILYSAEAMGSEGYHVFIDPSNAQIRPDDFSTLNGKRVGVNKSSVQEQLFIEWAEAHNVSPTIVESTDKTPELLAKLASGEFDALVTLDTYGNSADVVPVCKVGFAESYFGINQRRPDLKQELDVAMSRIFEENRDFNQQMTERYNKASSVNSFLTPEEMDWVTEHGAIRIGYRDDYLPFCGTDEQTQSVTGTLLDYLDFAETCQKNAHLTFETQPFSTTEEALIALQQGKIDCVFPLSISAYDGERYGIVITDPLVSTEMYVTVRTADHKGISQDKPMTVAVIAGNPNYETFIMDCFPNWKTVRYDSGKQAYAAVRSGEADCGLVSSYRINRMSDMLAQYDLSALTTGQTMNMSFAVNREDDCLYSILNKVNRLVPQTTLNSSLTNYSFAGNRVTFGQFLRDNLAPAIAVIAVLAAIMLFLLLKNVRAEAKELEGRQIISEAERDSLTGLYNWNFFLVYANRLYREHPERRMDAVVMNIDRFHSINDLYGREFGDNILRELGNEISSLLAETDGIASRFEADRFDIYCPHRDDWQKQLERFQARLDGLSHNTSIHLRMGVKPWQEGMEPVLQFDRARTACNKVRGNFKAQVVIYDSAMGQREELDQRLLNDLDRALARRELEVYYQPKYNIQSERPELSSAEALIRWQHPELGLIPPDAFIPLFERSGQISAIDNYVWAEAARQVSAWRDKLGVTLPVSVNLSRVDVFDPNLCSTLDGLVERYGLSNSDLKLEVTESAYTQNADQLIKVIEELRNKGYKIEMDDFGSGFSSLNMLSSMPIDVLKMDMAFVRNIERDERDFRLVELILDIARYLRVPVIAEGVETEGQLSLLRNAGCDLVQGYYFSRPLPPDEFEQQILHAELA